MSSSPSRLVQEGGDLPGPALLVHGGAGTYERLGQEGAKARIERGLEDALSAGWDVLERGGSALLAAVEAVVCLEDSGLFNAGRGSTPTKDGLIETDASVMDGATRTAGAVCAATRPANPIRTALAVANMALADAMTDKADWRPLLLAGAGADRLAEAAGLSSMTAAGPRGATSAAPRPSEATGSRPGQTMQERGGQEGNSPSAAGPSATGPSAAGPGAAGPAIFTPGTVGAVALDADGHVAAATSTGGRPGQPSGRVGDSSIVGAGTWADDATAAVSATGTGEAFILAGFGHRVDWSMRSGLGLDEALAAALAAVAQFGAHYGGTGGAIAIAPSGRYSAIFNTAAMARGWRNSKEVVVRV